MLFSRFPFSGITLMIAAAFLFSCMNAGIHALAGQMHPLQMVFLRNVASFVFAGLVLLYLRVPLRTKRLKSHAIRASVGAVAMALWFVSVTMLNLNMVTALGFTAPIFSTIIAMLFLGEKAGWRRWSAILAGFVGVLIVLQPWHVPFTLAAGIVLISSFVMAFAGVLIKNLTSTEPPALIVFIAVSFMVPLSLPGALITWTPFTWHQLEIIIGLAFCGTLAQLCMTYAFRAAEISLLMPFDFTRLIFSAVLAYVFFDELITLNTLAGGFIIVASSVYIAWRESVLNRMKALRALEESLEIK